MRGKKDIMMKSKTFQQKLNESLSRYKSNLAVEYGSETLTYEELDERTNYIANWLFDKFRKKGTFLGVLMDNRMELISTAVGLLKAGCVFIPLDSSYPDSRLDEMIRSTSIECIICDYGNFSRAEKINGSDSGRRPVEFIRIDDVFLAGKAQWFDNGPDILFDPGDKIYIYFTSGTTGKAKAIVGKNKGLRHFIDWEIETLSINSDFRTSQLIIPVFDVFLRDIFVPLCVGGTVCIPASKDIILNPGELIDWIDKNRIHLINCVPSLFRLMLPPASGKNDFEHLRFVLLAGEKINPPELVDWYDTFGERIQLVNLYGPTETTLAKIHYFIRASDTRRERIPIGKPMKGARVIILDEKMEICDTLVKGEIHIRTPYRAFGYYNDPGLNREKFIPNPFNNKPDDILYKTGDLGRFLPDGNIDILGRIDRQVKLRGMRIELEEIESVLLEHPSVQEAVAVKREISGNELLAAYVIGSENKKTLPGEETLVSRLKAYLSERLPDYMVPARIINIETIPRKPNGKIDYDSLPDPFREQTTGDILPRSDIQKKLAKIWWEILGVENIGVTARFFEVGGNSLNAMSLMAKIRKEFNIKISLREVFNNPTINHQEEIIKKQQGEKYISLEPTEKKEHYPLSSQQKRIYFFQQIDDKSIIYNINHAYKLEGDFNRERLENILGKLTRRHESLRTSFESINGEPAQRIHDEAKFTSEYFENCKDENRIKGVIKNFIRPFNLTKAPLLRVGLIKMAKEKHILITDIHHIIADGVSIAILMEEFTELYDGEGRSSLKLQYKDYSNWQNSKDNKDKIKKQEQFWMEVFSNKSPILDLPVDYPRNMVVHESEEKILWFAMDNELTKDLRRMLTQKEVTLYMILLAVYNVVLSKYCAQEDIVVGTAVSGRTHDDLRNIMGIFVNMLPLRNYPKGDKPFSQFLEEVKQNSLDALNNQDYPFEMLISRLNLDRDMKRNPLFDTVFQVQNLSIAKREIKGLTITPEDYELGVNPSRYELVFTAMEGRDNIHFKFQYSRQLYKKETIVTFYEHYINTLKTVLQDDDVKLIDIELDSGVQRAGMDMEKEEAANKIGLESKIDFGF